MVKPNSIADFIIRIQRAAATCVRARVKNGRCSSKQSEQSESNNNGALHFQNCSDWEARSQRNRLGWRAELNQKHEPPRNGRFGFSDHRFPVHGRNRTVSLRDYMKYAGIQLLCSLHSSEGTAKSPTTKTAGVTGRRFSLRET